MVEKPKPATAPSNLFINGRYILQPEIFNLLGEHRRGVGGEIQLTDAMIALSAKQPFYGFRYQGRTYDCGSKAGLVQANVAFALARPDLGPGLAAEMRGLLSRYGANDEDVPRSAGGIAAYSATLTAPFRRRNTLRYSALRYYPSFAITCRATV
jgi:hypothetical protein